MAGFAGKGTILTMSTAALTSTSFGATGAAVIVGDLTNISGPTMSAEEIDISSHDTSGNFREFVVGFKDAGEISLEGNLTADGGAAELVGAFKDRLNRNFHINFPVTSTEGGVGLCYLRWEFEGIVSGVETATPYDDKASFSASVRLSGAPTLTDTTTT